MRVVLADGWVLELGRADDDSSPVRRGRLKRRRPQRWGERELTPEGVAEVSC